MGAAVNYHALCESFRPELSDSDKVYESLSVCVIIFFVHFDTHILYLYNLSVQLSDCIQTG